ncbi:vegetative cell wall protein gp1 [Cryptomeria japonica]|uniref:vegetative cell wall protein gp1 n=1 Tax=Cryptomeria japonica TaxID=3369 RepID=UPI0025AD35EE|nr:vegetative cell wall protein gp1 [Cryptomeria japonica]
MKDRSHWMERELDTVPPSVEEERHPTPTSSPPTPPSPLPVSVGPGYQQYFFPSSPSNSPPFSPTSSSPSKPQVYETIPPPARSIPFDKKPSKAYTSPTEYSPLLPHFGTPPDEAEDDDYVEWSTNRRTARSFFRRCLEKIFCCCGIPDCCPPLFTD